MSFLSHDFVQKVCNYKGLFHRHPGNCNRGTRPREPGKKWIHATRCKGGYITAGKRYDAALALSSDFTKNSAGRPLYYACLRTAAQRRHCVAHAQKRALFALIAFVHRGFRRMFGREFLRLPDNAAGSRLHVNLGRLSRKNVVSQFEFPQ